MRKQSMTICAACLLAAHLLTACTSNEVRPPVSGDAAKPSLPAESTTQPPAQEALTISESEIYREDGVSVTVTGYEEGLLGPQITLAITNDTAQNLCITTQALSVNGFMMPTSGLYSEIAAGKKALESISLMKSELEQAGIETVADIDFSLHVYDADTLDDVDVSDLIHLRTSAPADFVQPVVDAGEVIYDRNGVRVTCRGLSEDLIWDGAVIFLIENNADDDVIVYTENVSVNGYMVDDSMWSELRPGTRSITGLYLLNLEEVALGSLDNVENIEFNLHLMEDDWDDIDISDPITLNFQ